MTVKELIIRLLNCQGDAIVCGSDNEAGDFEIDYVQVEDMPKNNIYIRKYVHNPKKIVILS